MGSRLGMAICGALCLILGPIATPSTGATLLAKISVDKTRYKDLAKLHKSTAGKTGQTVLYGVGSVPSEITRLADQVLNPDCFAFTAVGPMFEEDMEEFEMR